MTDTEGLQWEEPPPRRPETDWGPVARELRARPGEWALVAKMSSPGSAGSRAYQVRTGQLPNMPKGEFEAVARGDRLYVRFIGGAS